MSSPRFLFGLVHTPLPRGRLLKRGVDGAGLYKAKIPCKMDLVQDPTKKLETLRAIYAAMIASPPSGKSALSAPDRVKVTFVGVEPGVDIMQVNPTDGGQLVNAGVPLFSTMSIDDINQGQRADCYFLSFVAAVVQYPLGRAYLMQMIRLDPLDPAKVIVSYQRGGLVTRVHCGLLVATGFNQMDPNDRDLWVDILEKTYAFFRYGMDQYSSLDYGFAGAVASDMGCLPIGNISPFDPSRFTQLRFNLDNKIPTCLPTQGQPALGSLIGSHEYTLVSMDDQNNLTLRNPWGIDTGGSPYLVVSASDVTWDNFGTFQSGVIPVVPLTGWQKQLVDLVNSFIKAKTG